MKKYVLIFLIISSILQINAQALIGFSKKEIIEKLKLKEGKFRKNIGDPHLDELAYQVNSGDTTIESYYFNENKIAFSVRYVSFAPENMMKKIKEFNDNYISTGELEWTYYFRNQKLHVSILAHKSGKYFTIYYTNIKLGDFEKCRKKIWIKPTQADLKDYGQYFVDRYSDENLLPYFFKANFDNNDIEDEAWLLYTDDYQFMGVFAYMNNSQSPIEIFTFKFTYNSYIDELPIGSHQVYYKYNATTDEGNDIHEAVAKNKGIVVFINEMGDFYLWRNGEFERYAYSNY